MLVVWREAKLTKVEAQEEGARELTVSSSTLTPSSALPFFSRVTVLTFKDPGRDTHCIFVATRFFGT